MAMIGSTVIEQELLRCACGATFCDAPVTLESLTAHYDGERAWIFKAVPPPHQSPTWL